MPGANIVFDAIEDKKIREFSAKWNLNKNYVVKRMVREFKEMRRGDAHS